MKGFRLLACALLLGDPLSAATVSVAPLAETAAAPPASPTADARLELASPGALSFEIAPGPSFLEPTRAPSPLESASLFHSPALETPYVAQTPALVPANAWIQRLTADEDAAPLKAAEDSAASVAESLGALSRDQEAPGNSVYFEEAAHAAFDGGRIIRGGADIGAPIVEAAPASHPASFPQDAAAHVAVQGLAFRGIDHVLLFSKGNPDNLYRILQKGSFPSGVEVVSGDMSLVGWQGRLAYLYDVDLDRIRKEISSARKSGKPQEAESLQKEYRSRAREARNILKKFALRHEATGGVPKRILEISRQKSLRLWVGGPRYDRKRDKLYNSYFLVDNGRISAIHDKSFLYSIEKDILDAPVEFNGDYGNKIVLTCWEAEALNPHYRKPSPLHRLKRSVAERSLGKPLLLYIPGYWPTARGAGLRSQASKAVRRGTGRDEGLALRREGALALVNNDGASAYVMGPSRNKADPSRKAEIYAVIDKPGILRVRSGPDGGLVISQELLKQAPSGKLAPGGLERAAFDLAYKMASKGKGDIRFGAVLVKDGRIIGKGRNRLSTKSQRRRFNRADWKGGAPVAAAIQLPHRMLEGNLDYSIHAEQDAIADALAHGEDPRGATVYALGVRKDGLVGRRAATTWTCRRCAVWIEYFGLKDAMELTRAGWGPMDAEELYPAAAHNNIRGKKFWRKQQREVRVEGVQNYEWVRPEDVAG